MAKKRKPVQDLLAQKIEYDHEGKSIRVLSFDPNTMNIEISIGGEPHGKTETIPFAHLPKSVKKQIKPL